MSPSARSATRAPAVRPRMDGFAVCRRLQEESVVPAHHYMLDDHGYEPDRIKGLKLGADDYLVRLGHFETLDYYNDRYTA